MPHLIQYLKAWYEVYLLYPLFIFLSFFSLQYFLPQPCISTLQSVHYRSSTQNDFKLCVDLAKLQYVDFYFLLDRKIMFFILICLEQL